MGSKWEFLSKYWLEIITCALLLFMVVLVALAVILRYVFNTGIIGSFEAVGFAYVWLIFLGSVIGIKENAHISLDLFVGRLPKSGRLFVRCLGDLLVMFFLAVQTFYGIELIRKTANQFFSPVMGIPMHWIYLIFPVSGVLMFVQMVKVFRRRLGIEG